MKGEQSALLVALESINDGNPCLISVRNSRKNYLLGDIHF